MAKKRTSVLIFLGAFLTSAMSGFFIIMYFRREPHWTPDRFGGLHVALACIPICVVSYGVASLYAIKWLRPRLYPYLRARIPRPPTAE